MQLIIENLKKHYDKKETFALNNINLDIHQGEFISILGLSGSGKSTFIRCINRLIDPTEGKIYFEGQEITKLKGEALRLYRRNLAMIFQHYNLIPRMKVLTNVLVGRFGYLSPLQILFKKFPQEDLLKAKEALKKVGLSSFVERPIKTLSGGQQQRVGIARALIQEPKIILGDEPVSSLDPVTAKEVMLLLKEINEKEKITMIINLHSVELAKVFSKRIIGLNGGNIVFDGPPSALDEAEINRIYR
ncbi:phosphonate ABC transporter ATP-binding protein [Clostridium formicaceticum]|uniref:Phosphate-import ATP-binding protein PhnC n=1 Tax=Clostridium formicaceticum TaxID=1497 RepID=A0AAC9RK57_9CLOT|nr:phosphonate ABC transporter ATP-binding protein [Clostridium formicaceticum]AOY76145.1 phosphonate ABC transporter ATP-binding protein [Clostridium formicaceticum]ARE86513.1 Phosphate-import ATP-binding protein PhnC [Clostridium formicaceticum]